MKSCAPEPLPSAASPLTRPLRLLIVSHFYKPEPIPKASDLAEACARRGHQVEVITGFPNYPAGKLYPGFRLRLIRRELVDGVRVARTWVWPYHGRSTCGRLINYGSSMAGLMAGSMFTSSCDVIYVWHPPLSTGVAACFISLLKHAPFVYDVQDIWPESAVWAGMVKSRFLIWLMHRIESFVYRRAAHIIVVTEAARTNLIEKGVPPERVSVQPHWIDEQMFTNPAIPDSAAIRAKYGLSDRFVVMFAGNIGLVQALDCVLDAAQLLRSTRVVFVIVGDGADRERLEQTALGKNLDNVVFVARQPMERMPAVLAAADVLLVHLKASPFADLAIPTKTLAYLATGKPVLMAVGGASADLVRRARAGVVIPPEDAQALVAAVQELERTPADVRAQMGKNGLEFLLAHHSKEKVINDYVNLIGAYARP